MPSCLLYRIVPTRARSEARVAGCGARGVGGGAAVAPLGTSLAGGARIAKHSPRMMAIGDVDETNAAVGLARVASGGTDQAIDDMLARIQNDLFDLGSELARPKGGGLKIQPVQAARLESEIDTLNANLQALDSFVLPGGNKLAARLHLARTVARRAERTVTALAENEPVGTALRVYLNRLSDLLFVIARTANGNGAADVLWQPGATAE